MQLYECTVRLSGSLYNEVRKTDVTAAEIAVLKAIHQNPESGTEAITNIKPTKIINRDDYEERQRLENLYGEGLAKNERIRSLTAILGHETVPLPQTIPGLTAPVAKTRRKSEPAPVAAPVPVAAPAEDPVAEIAEQEFA